MIHLTFYKEVSDFGGKSHMEKVEFDHQSDNLYDAFEEAVKKGHNPNKMIMWRWVD